MNTYRVDRNNKPLAPCGMNGILYLGDNYNAAMFAFNSAKVGIGAWGTPNESYGVVFSKWHPERRDYGVVGTKGF